MRCERPGATQGRPRSHADGPRRGPERLKTAPRGPKKPPEAPRHAWERFRSEFRAILGPPGTSKNRKKCYNVDDFHGFRDFAREPSTEAQKAPTAAPRDAQLSPRRAPGGPRRAPGGQEPLSRPERAKRRPRPPRTAPGEHPKGPKPPRRLQGAFREPILAASWGPQGLLVEPSRRSFRGSRAVRSTDENTVRNHWSKCLSRPLRARCAEAMVH